MQLEIIVLTKLDQAEIAGIPHLEGNASCLSYLKHYNQKMYLLIIMISKTLFAVGSVRSVKGGNLAVQCCTEPHRQGVLLI